MKTLKAIADALIIAAFLGACMIAAAVAVPLLSVQP